MWTTIFVFVIIAFTSITSVILRNTMNDKVKAEAKSNIIAKIAVFVMILGIILINVTDFSTNKNNKKVTSEKKVSPIEKYHNVILALRYNKYEDSMLLYYSDELKEILNDSIDETLRNKVEITRDSILSKVKERTEKNATSTGKQSLYTNQDVDGQFSNWDGSHIKLEKYIKDHMNDPSSFEHVQTKYKIRNGYLDVIMTYRGKNAYNATITQTTQAKCSLNTGEVLEIVRTY